MLGGILSRQYGITTSFQKENVFFPRILVFNVPMHPHNLLKMLKKYTKRHILTIYKYFFMLGGILLRQFGITASF